MTLLQYRERTRSYFLALYLVALNAADWTITYIAIHSQGLTEMNPALSSWITSWPGYLLKTFGVGIIGWRILKRADVDKPAFRILVGACSIYTLVVLWNLYAVYVRGIA